MRKWINLLETDITPLVLYHSSATTNRDSIAQNGIRRSDSETAQLAKEMGEAGWGEHGGIFFSDTPEEPRLGIDRWAVDVSGLNLERDETTDHDHLGEEWWVTYTDATVEPTRLKLL